MLSIIGDKKVIITCGSGGVGKTTCAASLACKATQEGKKTIVLTVDPAKRLASSLGLSEFTKEIESIDVPGANGLKLNAMMLDARSTYDKLVRRYAANEEAAKKILNNRFYNHFSGAVGGSHEYTAMEKLHELVERGEWDLLILDTPPTVHALDFLDAPKRLIDAFDESIFRWMIKPYLKAGKAGMSFLNFGSTYILKTLKFFVGSQMLDDLSEFLYLFQEMFSGFRERALSVQKLLSDQSTSFLVVATAQPNSLKDASLFYRELSRKNYNFGGFLINRRLNPLNTELTENEILVDFQQNLDDVNSLAGELLKSQSMYQLAANGQSANIKRFLGGMEPAPRLYSVPLFKGDVADVEDLVGFADTMVREN